MSADCSPPPQADDPFTTGPQPPEAKWTAYRMDIVSSTVIPPKISQDSKFKCTSSEYTNRDVLSSVLQYNASIHTLTGKVQGVRKDISLLLHNLQNV